MVRDRRELVAAFTRAWGGGDLDTVMGLMAADCEFRCSVGPEPGARFVGLEQVRLGFARFLPKVAPSGPPPPAGSPLPAATAASSELICADFAVTRWTSTIPGADGEVVRVYGCDVFEFAGDAIRVKDTYRKSYGALPAEPSN